MAETTTQAVERLLMENPDLTVADLARRVGVSRQRVHQIVQDRELTAGNAYAEAKKAEWQKPTPRIRTSVVVGPITTTATGTVAELIAAADLIARGYHVFFPLVRTTRCDLVAIAKDGKRVSRIEVRSGRRSQNGKPGFLKKGSDECDFYAIVIAGEPVAYQPDMPEA